MAHYQLLALWSINERLAGRSGIDIPKPSLGWLDDAIDAYDRAPNNKSDLLEELGLD